MSDTEAFRNIPNGPILGSDACMRDRERIGAPGSHKGHQYATTALRWPIRTLLPRERKHLASTAAVSVAF